VALSPILIVSATSLLVILLLAMKRHHRLTAGLSLAGLAAAFIVLITQWNEPSRLITGLLVVDQFTSLYTGVLLVTTAAVLLIAYGYLDRTSEHKEEFYILTLLATVGSMVLVASSHFASFFLGLEILSVSLYALIAYVRSGTLPLEAGIKYLVLASSSAAFLLFGMALVYAELGTMNLGQLSLALSDLPADARFSMVLSGSLFVLVGVGFKLALVPFHLWTPDVYQGAPLPVTALIATISKASVFGLLLRWFHALGLLRGSVWIMLFLAAILSMLAGNLLALFQTNVKRILAYSSIAHMGYFFVAVLAGGTFAFQAATYYLIAYLITITGALGVLTVAGADDAESCELENYRGLFWRSPLLAGVLTAMLLSLAGIPLTAGFLGKFYVIAAGASSSAWTLVIVLILSSVIGLFYYLRIVVALYTPADSEAISISQVPLTTGIALGLTALFLFCFGIFPGLLWPAVNDAVRSLG
jgi:NADH-quinone oxidoreductase subunit N